MISGWKEFAFFECTPVADPHSLSNSSRLFSDPSVVSYSPSTAGSVLLLTSSGRLKEFNNQLEIVADYEVLDPSQRQADLVRAVPNTRLALVVSTQTGAPLEMRVYNLDTGAFHSACKVQNGANTFPLTCFDMLDDLSVLVLGFADGSVYAVRGDLRRDKGTRQRLVHSASTSITAVSLSQSGDNVFISAVNSILVASTTTSKRVIPLERTRGADLHCLAKVPPRNIGNGSGVGLDASFKSTSNQETENGSDTDNVVVARETDVVYYNLYHRGASFELPVPKRQIFVTGDGRYLVVVAVYQPQSASLLATETLRVLIVDLNNHLIAFNQYLSNGIRAIFECWGGINVVGSNGTLYVLKEKDLVTRLNLLKQQNLYQIAIKMAINAKKNTHTSEFDVHSEHDVSSALEDSNEYVLQLHQDFADYLFEKRDLEGSLQQYIAAIRQGQTSKAIKRFKDAQHTGLLLRYLESVQTHGIATPQHLTLQLICLTRMGADKLSELEVFINTASMVEDFDFETAISVLMETHDPNYEKLAAILAEKMGDADVAVQIWLLQLDEVERTLDYIQTVPVADALRILIQNSRVLLDKMPVETTGVLISLFTCKFKPRSAGKSSIKSEAREIEPSGDKASALFEPLQSYKAFMDFLKSERYEGSKIISATNLEQDADPSYLPPKPRLIFPSFINHDREFVVFLEACLESAPQFHSPEKDVRDLASTLFETYLKVSATESANRLLGKYASVLDKSKVQLVSQMFNFRLEADYKFLLGFALEEIVRQSIEQGSFSEAFDFFMTHSNQRNDKVTGSQTDMASVSVTDLCHQTLKLFVSNEQALEFLIGQNKLMLLLDKCMSSGKLTAAEILTEIGASKYLQIKDVKPFILQILRTSQQEQIKHLKLTDSYRSEIWEKMQAIVKQDNLVFQSSDCAECHMPLELPVVHFGCKHSFHQACVPEGQNRNQNNSPKCPRCLPETEALESLRLSYEQESAKEDYFLETLHSREDKQKVIADFISRGALSIIR